MLDSLIMVRPGGGMVPHEIQAIIGKHWVLGKSINV